jgi:hypothetical protein
VLSGTLVGVVTDEFDRRLEEERTRVERRYREVLKNSVAFEKRIRERWRQKNREKNARIVQLEARVAELERALHRRGGQVADRETKEKKLVALMVNDLGVADTSEPEMVRLNEDVRALPDDELDRTLAERLDLPYPVDVEVLDRALSRVEEPERISESGPSGFTGAPDMSHEGRPEEREGG